MGDTFDLFDGHCVGQNGLHTNFARQRNIEDNLEDKKQKPLPPEFSS